jgi:hypothetical protein
MAKKKAGKKKVVGKKKSAAKRVVKKVVTKVSKAAREVGGAVGKAVATFAKSLGEMKIDDKAAADQMHEIGTMLEDVARAKGMADDKAEASKLAKQSYESKVNLFMEKVRGFTHPKSLPLFDAAEREADQKDMLDAAAEPEKPAPAKTAAGFGL